MSVVFKPGMSQPKVIPGQPPQVQKHQDWKVTDEQINMLLANSKRRVSSIRGEQSDALASFLSEEQKGMAQFIMSMQNEIKYLQNKVDSLEKNAPKKPVAKKIPQPEQPPTETKPTKTA